MQELGQFVLDYGFVGGLAIIIFWLCIKYLPKFFDYKFKRAEERDYMMDTFKAVIENNSKVIENNSKVIELNSTTIKNSTDNAHKLEDKFSILADELEQTNSLIMETAISINEIKKKLNVKKK